jgi:plastocyanin
VSDVEPREHPEAAPPHPPRLPGWAYAVLGVLFAGALVWSFSRILLAVSKHDAAIAALLMALNILVWASLIAYGRRVRRRPASFPLVVLAALALIGAGFAANAIYGDRAPAEASEASGGGGGGSKNVTIALSAQQQGGNYVFTKSDLKAVAGGSVKIDFTNPDQVPHNFVLFNGKDATAPPLFRGDLVQAGQSTTYSFSAPPPGTYFFHCDVHPQTMTGTLTVAAAPTGGGQGGPPAGGSSPTETAQGTAFLQKTLDISGTSATITFKNDDAGVPHNMAIFQGSDATGKLVFRGDLVTGPGQAAYSVTFPGPGTYFFHCDVHPTQMTGTITVTGG